MPELRSLRNLGALCILKLLNYLAAAGRNQDLDLFACEQVVMK